MKGCFNEFVQMNIDKISLGFRVVLLVVTGFLVMLCVIKYIHNKNTTSIDFKTYHENTKDQYPSISMCVTGRGIFDGEKLNDSYGIGNNSTLMELFGFDNVKEYQMFLNGDIWNEKMVRVDYDFLTRHVNDLIHDLELFAYTIESEPVYRWVNQGIRSSQSQGTGQSVTVPSKSFPFLTSQRTASTKCLTFDFSTRAMPTIEGKIIRLFQLSFNVSKPHELSLSLFLHYPGQLLRAVPVDFEAGGNMGILSGLLAWKSIVVGMVEVIRRRHNSKESCLLESQRMSEYIYKKKAEEMNCKPSHWIDVDYPITCNNTEKMKKSNFADAIFYDPKTLKQINVPCDQLAVANVNIKNIYRGKTDGNNGINPQLAYLSIIFTSPLYKEIVHGRDYDIEGLVGNGGGYVGLFLGFAIWQIPDFCTMAFRWLSKEITN